ncbi:MAG: hypothetical protein GY821_13280 [Gammaproteobacteria bacterium]|nr:hypothetical protein [Gammaproteobacteria bacterium]
MIKFTLYCLLMTIPVLVGINVCLATPVSVSRYATLAIENSQEKTHLLQQVIQIKFPKNCTTVGEAMHFLLQFSGYHLAKPANLTASAKARLNQPLPAITRQVGPGTLQAIISILIGPSYQQLIDPAHRLIGFQLYPRYQSLYNPNANLYHAPIELNGEQQ